MASPVPCQTVRHRVCLKGYAMKLRSRIHLYSTVLFAILLLVANVSEQQIKGLLG